jgi:hypothetical protein
MATTTNFGWTTPNDTDLVKDGAAAIRTLGSAIDTSLVDLKGGTTGQVLAKASNTDMDFVWNADASGIPATIFDAKGDIIAASAADTAARLAVGANNTVLTADSSTGTGLKWATPSASTLSYTLLSTTALTAASTITVSGLSGYNYIWLIVETASSVNSSSIIRVRFNSDTASNYGNFHYNATNGATYAPNNYVNIGQFSTYFELGSIGSNAGNRLSGSVNVFAANSTTHKLVQFSGGGDAAGGGNSQVTNIGAGVYTGTSVISSCSIISSSGNFDLGNLYVYGGN